MGTVGHGTLAPAAFRAVSAHSAHECQDNVPLDILLSTQIKTQTHPPFPPPSRAKEREQILSR